VGIGRAKEGQPEHRNDTGARAGTKKNSTEASDGLADLNLTFRESNSILAALFTLTALFWILEERWHPARSLAALSLVTHHSSLLL
jgi:hypothetical protein